VAAERDTAVEEQIEAWRTYVRRRQVVSAADVDELEDHLRSRIADLSEAGLDPEEAFLVAVKRMGSLDALTREFAREHSDRLWKQLVLSPDGYTGPVDGRRDVVVMLVFAAVAAIAVKLPALFGLSLEEDGEFYAVNGAVLGLAPLAGYFLWSRRASTRLVGAVAALFLLGAVAANEIGRAHV
jgi:hypothetical protein